MSFDDLKLKTKLLAPLIGMSVLFAVVIAVGTMRLNDLVRRSSEISTHVDPAMLNLARAARVTNAMGRYVYQVLYYNGNDPRAKKAAANFQDSRAKADQMFDKAIGLLPAKASEIQGFKDSFDAIHEKAKAPEAVGEATPGLMDGSKLTAKDLDQMAVGANEMAVLDVQINDLAASIQTFNAGLEAQNTKDVEALKHDAAMTVATMIGLGLVAVLGGLTFSIWIAGAKVAAPLTRLGERMKRLAAGDLGVEVEGQNRADEIGEMAKSVQVFKENILRAKALETEASDSRTVAERERKRSDAERQHNEIEQNTVVDALAASLSAMAQGDLTARIDTAFNGRYEQIRLDFNKALDSLSEAMATILAATSGITIGSDEISSASDDLSRRTEQQAASLEQTAAALDQITATVRRSADGARQAATAASEAKLQASRSGHVMQDAVTAMGEIEQSAGQITQIIGVIDEIAFQTNLLALNAGVEAARAGDAGRGFAVVAQEVRALAQRSADAAKDIKGLIASSSDQVQRGVKLVGDTGQALSGIVAKVTEIDALVAEMAQSSQEQATGLSQVNTAVNQMDQVTQQNAAMVEESTAAAASLKSEARELGQLVGRFQIDKASRSSARRAAASPQLVRSGQQGSSFNPVAATRAKITASVATGSAALAASNWEEF